MSVRNDRRRRMLADEGLADPPLDGEDRAPGSKARSGPSSQRAYADAAHAVLERPIRDFVPSRAISISLAAGAAAALVGAMLGGHAWSGLLANLWGASPADLFDLAADRNASGWLAAMLMMLAGQISIYLYALRRHRVDDYHGRYRVWLWTALLCFAFSFGEATSFGALVRQLCNAAATASNVSPGIAWLAVSVGLLALAGARLVVEMWRCRSAVALLLLASTCVAAAAAVAHGWLARVPAEHQLLIMRGSWLAAYVLTLATLLAYARYVVLEIEGKVAVRLAKVKPAKAKKSKKIRRRREKEGDPAAVTPRKSVRTDLEPQEREPVASLKLSGSASAADYPSQHKLSRKERRRLRRAA